MLTSLQPRARTVTISPPLIVPSWDEALTAGRFWGVFWVDVNTAATATAGFLEVARKLKVPAETLAEARQALSNIQHPWLLVLDNADDPQFDHQDYFPASHTGFVLMTSRNPECHQYATVFSE